MKIEQFYIVMSPPGLAPTLVAGPFINEQTARMAMNRNYSGFTSQLSIVKVVLEGEVI